MIWICSPAIQLLSREVMTSCLQSPRWLLGTLLALGWFPAGAWAHNIDFEWRRVNERLRLDVFFDDDTPAGNARVELFDADGTLLGTATTDAQGKCELPAPVVGHCRLAVDAGGGHRKERTINIADNANSVTRREELTSFPWARVAIGVGVIVVVACAFLWSRRR